MSAFRFTSHNDAPTEATPLALLRYDGNPCSDIPTGPLGPGERRPISDQDDRFDYMLGFIAHMLDHEHLYVTWPELCRNNAGMIQEALSMLRTFLEDDRPPDLGIRPRQ